MPPSSGRVPPMVTSWMHAGRAMFLRKLGSTAAAIVLRREQSRWQGDWWGADETCRWRSREECCGTIVGSL